MTTRPPAWAAALRAASAEEGTDREALVGAVARHLAAAAPPAVRAWVGDHWADTAPLPAGVVGALPPPGAPDAPDALGVAHEALAGARERRRGVHYTPPDLARRLAEVALESLDHGDRIDPGRRISPGEQARGRGSVRGASGAPPPTVCDPACGGGSFLLAAARALADRNHGTTAILPGLVGLDLDPVAARVAATALVLWAGTAAAEPAVGAGDALAGPDWPRRPEAGFDLVLGNPPFQAQMGTDTARSAAEAARLRETLGEAAAGYVDTAALFLLAAVSQVRPGGVVLLIQPQSVLGSRDAAGVRSRLAEVAPLEGLWVCDEPVFAARTRVCAPVLRRLAAGQPGPGRPVDRDPEAGGAAERERSQSRVRGGEAAARPAPSSDAEHDEPADDVVRLDDLVPLDGVVPVDGVVRRDGVVRLDGVVRPDGAVPDGDASQPDESDRPAVRRWRGPAVTPAPAAPERPAAGTDPTSWAPLVAGLRGVPAVALRGAPLPEATGASAGFRDQFYGLVPHVREATGALAERPLVTSGLIDLAGCAWGVRPARYAKARWAAPVVDLDTLAAADPALARWVGDRLVPKVVVATQTRVIEAAVDIDGRWVPSTPVLALPAAPKRLWHLLAALLAPAASAWALHETAGTALVPDALKLSAAQLRRLPGPVDECAWDEGAAAARAAQLAATAGEREAALDALGAAMGAAHGIAGPEAEELRRWWRARWPREGGSRADNTPAAR